MSLDLAAISAGADDLNIAARQLRSFQYRLAATTAWRAGSVACEPSALDSASGNSDACNHVEAKRVLCSGQRALFRAYAQSVTGVFEVRASHQFPVYRFNRAADVKPGVWGVGLQRGPARSGDKLFLCHQIVLRRCH